MPSATEKKYSLMTSDALSAELARLRKAKEKRGLARQKEEQKLAALTGPLSEFNEILKKETQSYEPQNIDIFTGLSQFFGALVSYVFYVGAIFVALFFFQLAYWSQALQSWLSTNQVLPSHFYCRQKSWRKKA